MSQVGVILDKGQMKELDTDDKTREWITTLKGSVHDVPQGQDSDHRSQTQIPFKSKQGILSYILHFLQSLFIFHLSNEGNKSFCHQAHKSGI